MRETMYPFYTNDSDEHQRPNTSSFTPMSGSDDNDMDSDATTDCVLFSDDASDRVLRNKRNSTRESERRRLSSTLCNNRQAQELKPQQQDVNGTSKRKRKNLCTGSGAMNCNKRKTKSMSNGSASSSNANVFMESEDSLKSRRIAMLKLCQKNGKRIAEFNNKITELQKITKQAELEIQEIDHNLDQWVIEKRKRCLESLRESFLKKYEWVFLGESCPVCFEPYKESILYDECNHIMCSECNDSILSGNGESACPLCRTVIKGYTTFDKTKLNAIHYNVISDNNRNDFEAILSTDERIDLTTNEELV